MEVAEVVVQAEAGDLRSGSIYFRKAPEFTIDFPIKEYRFFTTSRKKLR